MSRQSRSGIVAEMGGTPQLPPALLRGPFTLQEAIDAGLSRWHLEGASWRRIAPATYIWAGLAENPTHRLHVALKCLPAGTMFSGLTATWLQGVDLKPCDPVEATVPPGAGVSARAGIALRRAAVDEKDIVWVRGLPATSMARTIADLALRLSLTEAVVIADAALHMRKVSLERLRAWASANSGRKGVRRLRRVIEYAEPRAARPWNLA